MLLTWQKGKENLPELVAGGWSCSVQPNTVWNLWLLHLELFSKKGQRSQPLLTLESRDLNQISLDLRSKTTVGDEQNYPRVVLMGEMNTWRQNTGSCPSHSWSPPPAGGSPPAFRIHPNRFIWKSVTSEGTTWRPGGEQHRRMTEGRGALGPQLCPELSTGWTEASQGSRVQETGQRLPRMGVAHGGTGRDASSVLPTACDITLDCWARVDLHNPSQQSPSGMLCWKLALSCRVKPRVSPALQYQPRTPQHL